MPEKLLEADQALVDALKLISEHALANDEAILGVVKMLITRFLELEHRIETLEQSRVTDAVGKVYGSH